MRLGVVDDFFPGNFSAIDDSVASMITDMGFTGIGAHFNADPRTDESLATVERVRNTLDKHNLEIVQFWGHYPSLLTSDDSVRQEAISIGHGVIKLAAHIGAHMACFRPTSMNPRGQWWAHPNNFTDETRQRLTESLAEIATACETYKVPMAMESHVTSTLDTPENIRTIFENTGSSWLKISIDPVNFAADIPTTYNTTAMINELFDVLGPYILAAHLKDVDVADGHVVHINEVIPGQGKFDFDTFFHRFQELLPDGYGLIEHRKNVDEVRQANTFIRQKIDELGIPLH
ncbi:MAG: sugar phosphate isomerase/epimerase [Anaerolineae bacterium]|nr:sugar phosphate isomerase/epimerase [Anaerolineae bacterium]